MNNQYLNPNLQGFPGMGAWGQTQAPHLFSSPVDGVSAPTNFLPQMPQIAFPYAGGQTPQMGPMQGFNYAGLGAAAPGDGAGGVPFFSTNTQQGYGGMALSAASGLASLFMGMKQYGLAKDTLNENKRQFQLNYDAQKTTTNGELRDRQAARVASNSGAYQSVGDYMNVNGVK